MSCYLVSSLLFTLYPLILILETAKKILIVLEVISAIILLPSQSALKTLQCCYKNVLWIMIVNLVKPVNSCLMGIPCVWLQMMKNKSLMQLILLLRLFIYFLYDYKCQIVVVIRDGFQVPPSGLNRKKKPMIQAVAAQFMR